MKPSSNLECYWISFPQGLHLPIGIGVTAFSETDALALIKAQGFDEGRLGASELRIQRGIRIEDLAQQHVVPNMGPMQLRGVWYPAMNVGYGAPRDSMYKPGKASD